MQFIRKTTTTLYALVKLLRHFLKKNDYINFSLNNYVLMKYG